MITNCVNPVCRVAFSHVLDGRIFTIDRVLTTYTPRSADRENEQYWLCGNCSKSVKIIVEDGRITTVPIDRETASLVR
jgi:hypothetical protein